MNIDFDRLREDLKQDSYAAAFVGGFGGALIESFDIDNTDNSDLIRIAEQKGIDLSDYYEE